MKFGIAVTGRANPKLIEKLAITAEGAGFDYFLVTDHFLLPNAANHIDVWSFLPYLAAKTNTIRLGSCVTPITLRPPAMLAKMVGTADYLSNGRIIFGVGFGWYRPEFEAFSTWRESPERIGHSREAIDLIKRLWTEQKAIDFDGKFIHAKGAIVEPKPLQKPFPPIWWGGHLPISLRMAGQLADGWMPIGPRWFDESYPKPDEYAKMRKVILGELSKRDYPQSKFVFTTLINRTDIPSLRKDVEKYVEAGMNSFTLGEKAENDSCLKEIVRVATEIGGSL
jgi:alkanesulfonate monooxygenase SsuD/methylene tetrahydromethanopterin reductase-like flavin-dependent oxidoreductase (luciferase family)